VLGTRNSNIIEAHLISKGQIVMVIDCTLKENSLHYPQMRVSPQPNQLQPKHPSLSALESTVMQLVWQLDRCSVKEVQVALKPEKTLAYTTVATILQRLLDKGLVGKQKEGMLCLFYPIVSKRRYASRLVRNFMHSITHSLGDVALVSFAESIDQLPSAEKKRLLSLLEKKGDHA
jgi:predicted transcriptional regulator